MKDDYTTNSHYVTFIYVSLEGWENILFTLGGYGAFTVLVNAAELEEVLTLCWAM